MQNLIQRQFPDQCDHLIVGAGIAGLVAALELIRKKQKVVIIDARSAEQCGGQALLAFGGMLLVGTPEQKRLGIKDSVELAKADWYRVAAFSAESSGEHYWQKQWADYYLDNCLDGVYGYVKDLGLKYLPAVNWVERGWHITGNSMPRYHILWGCSKRLVEKLLAAITREGEGLVEFYFNARCEQLEVSASERRCRIVQSDAKTTEVRCQNLYIASGGFSGSLAKVRNNWPADWGKAPQTMLNGALLENDGQCIDLARAQGARVTGLSNMWNYVAGISLRQPMFEGHGLSLIPCKSALWLDHRGNRIGPEPLVTGFDTQYMCQRLAMLGGDHSWQVLNQRIAAKELAVSGNEYNDAIREQRLLGLLKEALLGNKNTLRRLLNDSDDFVMADTLEQLAAKMQEKGSSEFSRDALIQSVTQYDEMLARGPEFWNDEQIRRILQLRQWRSEKIRTCYPKPIGDNKPYVAIKLRLITRKCLGGIQTNLNSQVLDLAGKPIPGLFAVGEAAGFGGGGAGGKSSLEGTFLAGAILNARAAVKPI